MLLRFRPGLKSFLGDPRFSRRLQITWAFGDQNSSGMPSDEDSDAMRPMEDRLVEALEAEQAGILAFVHTHGGKRQWHFYIAESCDLRSVINQALAESTQSRMKASSLVFVTLSWRFTLTRLV